MRDERSVAIGKVGRPHGLNGRVYVDLYNRESTLLHTVGSVSIGDLEKTFSIGSASPSNDRWIVEFSEVSSLDDARSLVSKEISVPRDALPELSAGEFYCADLVGMKVEDPSGAFLGILEAVWSTRSNDIFVVRNGGLELLLPRLPNVILSIDADHRVIVASPPEVLDAV